jgi:hypothetical protein
VRDGRRRGGGRKEGLVIGCRWEDKGSESEVEGGGESGDQAITASESCTIACIRC